ncbi:MAG: DegT/DnrJ/EryC1/StrS family aminotransferase [Candidatus Woesearchaeota archaeon]
MASSTKNKIIKLIQKYTDHRYVMLTDSGNLAIYAAMYYLKQKGFDSIIIPDQGGWLTYKQYPKKLKLDIIEMRTDEGVVILDYFDELCELVKKEKRKVALLITSLAGYHAEQPLRKISEICKKHGILLIEDTNAIGDRIRKDRSDKINTKLCNGNYADIIIGSFGRWKVVDNEHGGFISSNDKEVIDVICSDNGSDEKLMEKIRPKDLDEEKLLGKLEQAHERLNYLIEMCSSIKNELAVMGVKVFNKDKRGIVVIAEHSKKVIDYCKKNRLEYTECPRYIRINKKAISIEVKRMSMDDFKF